MHKLCISLLWSVLLTVIRKQVMCPNRKKLPQMSYGHIMGWADHIHTQDRDMLAHTHKRTHTDTHTHSDIASYSRTLMS